MGRAAWGLGAAAMLALAALAGQGLAAAPRQLSYAIVNDGVFVVMSVQARTGRSWSGNLLTAPVEPGQTVELSIPEGRPRCIVDLAINTDTRSMSVVLHDQNICEQPRFAVAAYFDPMDLPGMGRFRPGLERGVPLCPGDVRCKKKK